MSKSKYPKKLDTSVELPAVRDNITELTSDVINSLRSAIFQIEKTLGINPQGASGSTVASRLSRVIDDSGNIKKEALDRSNILSGPITNIDVSKVAGIQESKLKLNFPTNLLQSEISVLGNQLDALITQLEEINAQFSVHVHPDAKDRHSATSISVNNATSIPSSTATQALSRGTLQETIEAIYNAHINYSGGSISETNASHLAEQIFFDKENVSDVILSDDVQGAIEDLSSLEAVGLRTAALNFHSNGRIRTGSVLDGFGDNDSGEVLLSGVSATYTQAGGSSRTTFNLLTPTSPTNDISEFDILTLGNSTTEADNKDYQISSVTLNGSDKVTDIEVYGGPIGTATSGISVSVSKNIYKAYNQNGLNASVRPRTNRTNTPDILVSNPDAATLISSGLIPTLITATTGSFDISIDDGDFFTVDTHDSAVSVQTIDSVVNKINEFAVDNHLAFSAFKLKVGACFEIGISHILPNRSGDLLSRTIELAAGASNDGTAELGLTSVLDKKTVGETGNKFHINGLLLSDFGKIQSFDGSKMESVQASNNLRVFSGTFEELGVRVGDTVVVTASSASEDDGAYRIKDVNGDKITLDYDGGTFAGSLSEDSLVDIIRNSARIDELTFTEAISATGSILFDVFLSADKDINYKKRMEVDGALSSGSFTAGISNVSRGFIVGGQTASISISTAGLATLTGPDSLTGESVFVGATGTYRLFSSTKFEFVTIDVLATGNPSALISVDLFGFDEVSDSNYLVSRGLFGTSLGIVLGESSASGVPVLIDKRKSGTVDDTIVGEALLERYIEGPRNELRSSGIISGAGVSGLVDNGTFFNFDVSAGVAIVSGKRYEHLGAVGIRFDTSSNFYIALDEDGCVIAGDEVSNPGGATDGGLTNVSPFHGRAIAHLAYIDVSDNSIMDLRLFVDKLDHKLLSEVIVGNDLHHAHFTDLSKAILYCDRFSGQFVDLGNPSILILPGEYSFSTRMKVNFDLTIRGSGQGTILKKSTGSSLAAGIAPTGSDIFMSKALFLIGEDSETASTRISRGVTFKDFSYESNDLSNVGIVFALTQDLTTSVDSVYRFEGISFYGPDNMDGSVADANKIGEYALYIGQQNPADATPDSSITMGNVLFSNCYLDRMGLGNGAIYFTESSGSTMQDIVVSGNIGKDLSPNVGNTSVTILEIPTTPTSTRFVETGNSVSD